MRSYVIWWDGVAAAVPLSGPCCPATCCSEEASSRSWLPPGQLTRSWNDVATPRFSAPEETEPRTADLLQTEGTDLIYLVIGYWSLEIVLSGLYTDAGVTLDMGLEPNHI